MRARRQSYWLISRPPQKSKALRRPTWYSEGLEKTKKRKSNHGALIFRARTIAAMGIVISPHPCLTPIRSLCPMCGTITTLRLLRRDTHPSERQTIVSGSPPSGRSCHDDEHPYESSHSISTASPCLKRTTGIPAL